MRVLLRQHRFVVTLACLLWVTYLAAWLRPPREADAYTGLAQCLLALLAAFYCARAAARSRRAERLAWVFLALGSALTAVGEVCYLLVSWRGGTILAAPAMFYSAWATLYYFVFVAFYLIAFLKPHRNPGRLVRPAVIMDALMLGLFLMGFHFYFLVAYRQSGGGLDRRLAGLLYALILGLGAAIVLYRCRQQAPDRRWRRAYSLLVVAVAFDALNEAIYAMLQEPSGIVPERFQSWTMAANLLQMACFTLLALSAGQPAEPYSAEESLQAPPITSAWRELFVPFLVLIGLLYIPLFERLFAPEWFSLESRYLRNEVLTAAMGLYVLLVVTRQLLVQMENRSLALDLQHESSRLRLLVDHINDVVVIEDLDGRVAFANDRFFELFGLSRSQAPPLRLEDFIHPEDRPLRPRRSLTASGRLEAARFEFRGVRQDGAVLYLESSRAVVRQHDVARGVQSVIRDITERRNLEAQLQQAQKMEAVGVLAGGIAHDFNNLLTAILGNVSLALLRLGDDHPAKRGLLDAEQAAERAAELIRQLLSFSRKSPSRPRPTSLNACVAETVSMLRCTIDPRIVIEIHEEPELWLVEADASQMHQSLMNLCLNARDAMPEGGRLTIATANRALDGEFCRHEPQARCGEFVQFSVADTGIGMDPDTVARIFEPFFTTKGLGKGTGLGLAMVYGIVKQHGGWVTVKSKPATGSVFSIFLPRSYATLPQQGRLPVSAAPAGSGTILLVDDEEVILNLGRAILQDGGHHILEAHDGEEAIRVLQQERKNIDLVLLDMTMPRKSGRDTLQEIHRLAPEVPVVLSSGYTLEGGPDELMTLGARGFVQKPYRPDELVRVVREALDSATRTGPKNSPRSFKPAPAETR
ncbi:MAG: response regulator [Acidobacteria bacterium]|nr:response regulator [Acidobacteriota bacterium]